MKRQFAIVRLLFAGIHILETTEYGVNSLYDADGDMIQWYEDENIIIYGNCAECIEDMAEAISDFLGIDFEAALETVCNNVC